jgi:APA family basic amino acid/polyamine antiporter
VIPLIAIAVNLYLMTRLPGSTWILFGCWVAVGIVIYLAYGQRRSVANQVESIRVPN